MDIFDLGDGRGEAGADGPDRLIGQGERPSAQLLGNRTAHLPRDDFECPLRLTLIERLADTDDRLQTDPQRSPGLIGRQGVGLAVERPPLGMAEDHQAGSGVGQHLRRDVAGERPRRLDMAVLAAHQDVRSGHCLGQRRHQRGRRTDGHPGPGGLGAQGVGDGPRLGGRGGQAVHLPIAGDQFAQE